MRWIRNLATAGLLATLAWTAVGCANPCDELAEITCEKVGADAPLCRDAQRRAESAGRAERATCEKALKLLEAAVEP